MTTETQTDTSADAGQADGADESTTTDNNQSVLNADGGDGEQGQATDQSNTDGGDEGEFKIDLPEGVEIDEKMLEGFTKQAKEAGLNSESATKMASWYASQQKTLVDAQAQAWEKQGQDWVQELRDDPDFGGKEFDSNAKAAARAVREYGGTDLGKALQTAGLDNYPPLVKAFARIGRALGEDSTSADRAKGGGKVELSREDALKKLYNAGA